MKLTDEMIEQMVLEELNEGKYGTGEDRWERRKRQDSYKTGSEYVPHDLSQLPSWEILNLKITGNVLINKLVSGEMPYADINRMDNKLVTYVLKDPSIEMIGDKLVLKQAEN